MGMTESSAGEGNQKPEIVSMENYRGLEAGREWTGAAKRISVLMGRRPGTRQHKGSPYALPVRSWPVAFASRSDVGVEVLGSPGVPPDPERRAGARGSTLRPSRPARSNRGIPPRKPPACQSASLTAPTTQARVKISDTVNNLGTRSLIY